MGITKTALTFNWGPQPPSPIVPQPPPWATSLSVSGESSTLSCSADYNQEVWILLIQVGVPTVPASFSISLSPDGGTNWYPGSFIQGPTVAVPEGQAYTIAIPLTTQAVKISYTACVGPAGVSSTIFAQLGGVPNV